MGLAVACFSGPKVFQMHLSSVVWWYSVVTFGMLMPLRYLIAIWDGPGYTDTITRYLLAQWPFTLAVGALITTAAVLRTSNEKSKQHQESETSPP